MFVVLDVGTQVVDGCRERNFGVTDGLIMTLLRRQRVVGIVDDTICRLFVTIKSVMVVNCVAVVACLLSYALDR